MSGVVSTTSIAARRSSSRSPQADLRKSEKQFTQTEGSQDVNMKKSLLVDQRKEYASVRKSQTEHASVGKSQTEQASMKKSQTVSPKKTEAVSPKKGETRSPKKSQTVSQQIIATTSPKKAQPAS